VLYYRYTAKQRTQSVEDWQFTLKVSQQVMKPNFAGTHTIICRNCFEVSEIGATVYQFSAE
jgi:hypothetical protein